MFTSLDLHYSILVHKQNANCSWLTAFLGLGLFCSQTLIFCSYTSLKTEGKPLWFLYVVTRKRLQNVWPCWWPVSCRSCGKDLLQRSFVSVGQIKGRKTQLEWKRNLFPNKLSVAGFFSLTTAMFFRASFIKDKPHKHAGPLPSHFRPGLHRWAH